MAEPKVRFKRDDGSSYPAWNDFRLGDICDPLQYGMNAAAKAFDGKNKYIRITDIDESTHRYLMNDIVSPDGDLDEKYAVGIGDILFARTGASTGKSYLYNPTDGKMYFAGFLIRAHVKEGNDAGFIYAQTQTKRYNDWVIKTSQRSGQPGINAEEYSGYIVRVAESLEEQQKIADFLSSVDEVITASEEEVANLETQKKAVMKKIFSQEVRFKRADGSDFQEWEKQTLGNLAEFSKGQGYTKSDLSETGSPIILYGRLYTKYQTVISEVDTFAEMKPRSVLSKMGDVIVPASGETAEDISVAAVVDVDGIILGGDLNIIHPCNAILPDYLAYALTFGTPHQEMAKRAQGKSIVHLHNDDLKSAVIVYPCLEEQRLISDFLSDFDEAIAAAKKELELWKELKKGLLQQMFV